jgi:hypothetical protein
MLGARVEKDFFAPAAKERQGTRTDIPANLPEGFRAAEAREEAAELVNVSPRTIQHAKTVLESPSPDLKRAVDQGKIAVSAAASVAQRPAEEQAAIVARVESGAAKNVPQAVRQIEEQKRAEVAPAHAARVDARPPREPRRNAAPSPFCGLIGSAENSTSTWRGLVDGDFYRLPKLANSTVAQRKELIAALKTEIRAANRFITWLTKQAGRTKSS